LNLQGRHGIGSFECDEACLDPKRINRSYFGVAPKWPPLVENVVERLVPKELITVIRATPIKVAMRAYSMAVAPALSSTKRFKNFNISVSQRRLSQIQDISEKLTADQMFPDRTLTMGLELNLP